MNLRYTMMNILDDTTEDILYDPTTLDVSKFKFKNGYYPHTISQRDKERPYKISSTYYGTTVYDNLILLINNVRDIWDLPVGTELKIPKLEDLKSWITKNRK
jgi:hypothetical protein